MKIVTDNNTFIIPFLSNRIVISFGDYKQEIINCLMSYFVSKKKTKCIVYDDIGSNPVKMDDFNFICIPDDISYEGNFSFRPKTVFNNDISEIINNNEEYFSSIYQIREGLNGLQSDFGFIKLMKIINRGLRNKVEFEYKELNLSLLLQMFELIDDDLTMSQKQIIILNLLLYKHHNETCIVLLDKNIDDDTLRWISECDSSVFFIVDNDSLIGSYDNFDFIIESNKDHLIIAEEENENIKILSYMHHDLIRANRSLQNKKNIELFDLYSDRNSTFFIKNNSYSILE